MSMAKGIFVRTILFGKFAFVITKRAILGGARNV